MDPAAKPQMLIRHAEEIKSRMLKQKENEKRDYQTYSSKLPSYFYNINGRHGLDVKLERSLRETATITSDLKENFSSFRSKSFRAKDSSLGKTLPKQSKWRIRLIMRLEATFNQLLTKFGYLQEEEADKPRIRPWHALKVTESYESSSEDDMIAWNNNLNHSSALTSFGLVLKIFD